MIKILVLQQPYNLAGDALAHQLLDFRSFLQFLGLTESRSIPDAKTLWLFRDRLAQAGVGDKIFNHVQQQLLPHGYLARCGQNVDAPLVQAPVQRRKRSRDRQGRRHRAELEAPRARNKVDARWTKKHGKDHLGYKLLTNVDKSYKFICKLAVTHATVADTTVFEELLEPTNTNRDVYADQGYPSIERDTKLKQAGWRVQIQRRGHATQGTPMRRNDATTASLRRASALSMCLALWRKWAGNWYAARASYAPRLPRAWKWPVIS
jgi:IS5 family transposase